MTSASVCLETRSAVRWRVPVSRGEDRRVRHQLHVGPGDLGRLGVEDDRPVHLRHLVEHRRRVVDVELDPAGEQVGDVARVADDDQAAGAGVDDVVDPLAQRAARARRRRAPSVAGDPDVPTTREAHPQAVLTSPSRMANTALECGLAISEWTGRDSFVKDGSAHELAPPIRRLEVEAAVVAWCGVPRAGRRPPRGRGRASGSRTKAQVRTVPTAQSATRTQVEPAIAVGEGARRPPSRAWKTAPVAASATVPAITRSIASTPEAMPDLLGRHRRHRRGRHRRVDEAERDPEGQVAGEQQARRSCRRRPGSGRAGRATPQAMPGGHQPPGAEAGDQPPREGRDEDHRHRDRQDQQPAERRPSGRARPAGTGAGRTSPPSRRRPGRRRRRWRRSRGRCGRARSRRSARATRCSIRQKARATASPTDARAAIVAAAPGLRPGPAPGRRAVRPTLSASQAGEVDPRPDAGSVDSGAASAVIAIAERRDRQVDPEDHPPVDFDQGAAGERADRQRQRRDPPPRCPAPAPAPRRGRRCRRSPARAAASAPRRSPAAPGRRSASARRRRRRRPPSRARRRPCRRGRAACGRTCRRAARR